MPRTGNFIRQTTAVRWSTVSPTSIYILDYSSQVKHYNLNFITSIYIICIHCMHIMLHIICIYNICIYAIYVYIKNSETPYSFARHPQSYLFLLPSSSSILSIHPPTQLKPTCPVIALSSVPSLLPTRYISVGKDIINRTLLPRK